MSVSEMKILPLWCISGFRPCMHKASESNSPSPWQPHLPNSFPQQRLTNFKTPQEVLLSMNSKCPPSQSPETLFYRLPSQVTVQGPQNLTLLHPDRLMAPSCPPIHGLLSRFHHPACFPLARPTSRLFLPLPSHPECLPLPASPAPQVPTSSLLIILIMTPCTLHLEHFTI